MFRKNPKYKIVEFFSDVPKVRPNEMLFIPRDNRLMEVGPWQNNKKKPDWFISQNRDEASIRTCYGTLDFISLGITLPMWTNVNVRPTPDGRDFELRCDPMSTENPDGIVNRIEGFPASSISACPFTEQRKINGHYPKLVTPWLIKTAPGWSTLVLPQVLDPNPNYTVMPGVIHTDFYHIINIVLSVTSDKPFTIPIGQPMYQLIPFKRNKRGTKLLEGNQSMFRFLQGRGTGEHYLNNIDRGNAYKREQRKADEALKKNRKDQ
jgi:hypothetical protein